MANALTELLVKLGLDAGTFNSEIQKAQRNVQTFASETTRALRGLQELFEFRAAVEAGRKLVEFAAHGAEAQEQMARLSALTGSSVEDMQRLSFAANQVGVSTDTLSTGFKFLSKNMQAAASGSGQQAALFKAMGVAVTDANGRLLSTGVVFRNVVEALSRMRDGAAKTSLELKLFGKSGSDLGPLFEEGAAGIDASAQEAERLGAVLSGETSEAAKQFGDELKKVGDASTGLSGRIAAQLEPMMHKLITEFESGGPEQFDSLVRSIGTGVKILATVVEVAAAGFEALGNAIGGALARFDRLVHLDFKGMVKIDKAQYEDAVGGLSSTLTKLDAIWSDAAVTIPLRSKTIKDKSAQDVLDASGDVADGARQQQQALSLLEREYGKLAESTATFGDSKQQIIEWRMASGDLADAFATAGPAAEHFRQEILAQAAALEKLNEAERETRDDTEEIDARVKEARSLWLSVRSPLEKYNTEIEHYNELLVEGAIDQDTFNRLIVKSKDEYDAASKKLDKAGNDMSEFAKEGARNIQDKFAQFLFDPFKEGLSGMVKGFGEVIRQIIAQAIAARIMKALLGDDFGSSGKVGAGSLVGSLIPSLVGKASGGPVSASSPYIVGEQGPEMFVPNTSGSIIPAGQWGMGGVSITNHIDARGADPASAAAMMRALEQNSRQTEARIYDAMRRGYAPI